MSTKSRSSLETISASSNINGSIGRSLGSELTADTPTLLLESLNDTFAPKTLDLFEPVKIGRKLNPKVTPEPNNGIFDAKVLSRNHAEIWFAESKVWIKDVKSSNGTFLNGHRLSAEGFESEPFELKSGAVLEFGLDIKHDDKTFIYKKVACKVSFVDFTQMVPPSPGTGISEPVRTSPGIALRLDGARTSQLSGLMDAELKLADKTHAQLQQLKESMETIGPIQTFEHVRPDSRLSSDPTRSSEEATEEAHRWRDKYNDCLPRAEERDIFKKQAEDLAAEVERLSKESVSRASFLEEVERWKTRSAAIEAELLVAKRDAESQILSLCTELKSAQDKIATLEANKQHLISQIASLQGTLMETGHESSRLREAYDNLLRKGNMSSAPEAPASPSAALSDGILGKISNVNTDMAIAASAITTSISTPKKGSASRKRNKKHPEVTPSLQTRAGLSSPGSESQDETPKPASKKRETSSFHIFAIVALGILSIGGIAVLSLSPDILSPESPFLMAIREAF
ncbi:hypothetical protein HKX48_005610 [Thoreauomyces humboldtii]|nr:hypothetical protein HKX48_005610 [Thoreauomyces humboldtii]